jgi:hypothetical protein
MYYWHLILIPQDMKDTLEWYTWADTYEQAKVSAKLIYGVRSNILSCVRVSHP